MKGKVFCIGMNKTGTTSLHALFLMMGFRSFHGMYSDIVNMKNPHHSIFSEYDCFSDGEMHDFIFLDQNFPGSKFILTTRQLDQWLISRIKHVQKRRNLGRTGWMREEFERNPDVALKNWITRRQEYHSKVFDYFKNRANEFLAINICNSNGSDEYLIRKISAFLGVAAPAITSLPWANPSPDLTSMNERHEFPSPEEQVKRVLTGLDFPEDAWKAEI